MTIQIETKDGKVLLRSGMPDNHTCVEIPYREIPDAIRVLFFWLAWFDNRAAQKLTKKFESTFDETSNTTDHKGVPTEIAT